MPYAPIDSYGLIGNMKTAALVGRNGSIDWLCLPHFDSPSVFAAILDDRVGGRFDVHPHDDRALTRQFYLPDTNVLVTRSVTPHGVGEVHDFMPTGLDRHDHCKLDLVRYVSVLHGELKFNIMCQPALNYGRDDQDIEVRSDGALVRGSAGLMHISSTTPLEFDGRSLRAEMTLREGQVAAFAVRWLDTVEQVRHISADEADDLLEDTVAYWRQWISQCTYSGRWNSAVTRSALALKLMTFEPTGAIVAAPTCSLPEHIGGARNWDYRYTWLRDAAFTIYALLRIGFNDEAAAFMNWLQDRSHELEPDRLLRPLYGIDGRHDTPESVLEHFEGYRGSGPVRIGNEAYEQLQVDVSGALIDAAYVFNRDALPVSHELWCELRKITNWTCKHWQEPDHGIWEMRGNTNHFVYSKLMCWVALDRCIRIAEARSFPGELDRWRANRDQIYNEIMSEGWSEHHGAFMQVYGGKQLDASNLMLPIVGFTSPNDPRMLKTIDRINRPLWQGGLVTDFIVYRYNTQEVDDGVGGEEGGFNICTFWMVQALTLAGRVDKDRLAQARSLFERALRSGSELGLFAEQIGVEGEALGNYPQALTHLSLIVAADQLDRAIDGS